MEDSKLSAQRFMRLARCFIPRGRYRNAFIVLLFQHFDGINCQLVASHFWHLVTFGGKVACFDRPASTFRTPNEHWLTTTLSPGNENKRTSETLKCSFPIIDLYDWI
ncbi:hypothetical protein TNIN_347791 [Trichonephila inaurata madagascariensis]|uniref:Uncharacterized protein n=1 Tax=Trichonephila inaurata madagascariensis TaxID=2747483 RepID=A0A8X7C3J3_9ARAC|nr:hypothetical protein TNIN_347791 [Trichonephila inaurata madagascariensis]